MAKLEQRLRGDFSAVLAALDDGILGGSMSATYEEHFMKDLSSKDATYEDGSDYTAAGVRCAVRVYERYSMAGGNRVSLNLTLVGAGEDLFLSAITSGGSQATLFKINTLGEGAFLDKLQEVVDSLPAQRI